MKLATVLVLSLVILGATARRGGGHKKHLRKCGIKRDFCDQGQRPHVRPFERDCSSYVGNVLEKVAKGEKPKREECTVGDMVTFLPFFSRIIICGIYAFFYLGNEGILRFVRGKTKQRSHDGYCI